MKNITTFDLKLLNKFDKIWCLVSGGIDSTYLAELISERYPEKTYFVNCYNPYESSKTLQAFKQNYHYMEVRGKSQLDYKKILDRAFLNIPKAIAARKRGKYEKKIFSCCQHIKHKEFKNREDFKTPNTVVISGIKAGDSQLRGWFLKDLKTGNQANYFGEMIPGFFHRHKEGQLYCYPFRDYHHRELPKKIIEQLKQKYPHLTNSGCQFCPVLVVFADKFTAEQTGPSIRYYHKLIGQRTLLSYNL